MHSCRCHIRALESLTSDLAGFHLRQQRAQRFFKQSRQISTRPPVRQLESAQITSTDDAFIPFDIAQLKHKGLPTSATAQASHVAPEKGGSASEDWHAEIEIVSQAGTADIRQESAGEQRDRIESDGDDGLARAGDGKTVDTVQLGQLHPSLPVDTLDASAPVVYTEQTTARIKSRAESRLERKARRMDAGKYRIATPAISQQTSPQHVQSEPTQMQTVLAKLNKLEGDGARLPASSRATGAARLKEVNEQMKARREAKKTEAPKQDRLLPKPKREKWAIQKNALEHKFGEAGWQPRKRLSPDTLEGIRALHASDPASYSTELLSEHFKITPEAIRRILRSKWRPNDHEAEDRKSRWERRGVKKWQDMAEQGVRPPAKWRAMGVGSADGPAEEKVPKRRRGQDDDHVSWDGLVWDGGGVQEREVLHESIAERLL